MADFRSKSAITVAASKPRGQPNPLLAMFRDVADYSSATCGTLDNGIGSNTFGCMTPIAVTWLGRSVKRPFSEPVRAWIASLEILCRICLWSSSRFRVVRPKRSW